MGSHVALTIDGSRSELPPADLPQFEGRRTCSANPACSHLWGNCCPSDDGMVLDCCHESPPPVEDPVQVAEGHAKEQFLEAPSQFLDVPSDSAGPPMPPTYA